MMNKQAFLAQLRKGLSGLPREDIEERLTFYSEMIDDRTEEGLSEEEAVSGIGPVDTIISQSIADTPLAKIAKERISPKRRLKTFGAGLSRVAFTSHRRVRRHSVALHFLVGCDHFPLGGLCFVYRLCSRRHRRRHRLCIRQPLGGCGYDSRGHRVCRIVDLPVLRLQSGNKRHAAAHKDDRLGH